MNDEAKRTRVRCSSPKCSWQGQRKLPAACPICDAALVPSDGKPGRRRVEAPSRRRVRVYARLWPETIAELAKRGDVGTEVARIVEASIGRKGS